MKICEIMNDIIGPGFLESRAGWCVDGLKYGNPDGEVSRVAVCLTATVDVIRAAAEWGAQLIITHEPTFGTHLDDERDMITSVIKAKMLEEAGLTVYRWHDSTHFYAGDKIGEGFIRHMGWEGDFNGDMDFTLYSPKTPLGIAREISEKLGVKHPRIIGKLDGEVTRINLSLGARGSDPYVALRTDDHEVAIAGEICEWYDGEPIRDLAQLGYQKTLIVLGHAGSERDGMADLADRINSDYKDAGIEAKYFECGELYTYAD